MKGIILLKFYKERRYTIPSMVKYNPNINGSIGLSLAIAWFSLNEYAVSVPTLRQGAYDLLIDKYDGKILKVKVVTTIYKTPYGKYEANLQTLPGMRGKKVKFDSKLVDFLFIICSFREFYLIPSFEYLGSKKINPESYPSCKVDFFSGASHSGN